MGLSLLYNSKQLTNEEINNIIRNDILRFIKESVSIAIPIIYNNITPEGLLELSNFYSYIFDTKSVKDLAQASTAHFGSENYIDFISLIIRITIPMGIPFEISGNKSLNILDEIIYGFRIPYTVLSSNRIVNPTKKYLFINGIGCDLNTHNHSKSTLDEYFGTSFDGVYNPTHSIPTDILTIVTQYFTNKYCILLFKCVLNYLYSVVGTDSITVVTHSKGTITISYIITIMITRIIAPGYLKNATKKQRRIADTCIGIIKKMRVYALANCAMSNHFLKIGDKYYPELYSFCNKGDPVPLCGRLSDMYLQYYTDMEQISDFSKNNIETIVEDDIINIVDPLCVRNTTSYLDKLYTLEKPGHLIKSYLFRREERNYNQDYFYEIFKEREL
jgi:hypothetical protein